MKGTPNNGLSIMSVAAMRRFFYPFDGIDLPMPERNRHADENTR